jgi:phenylalanyl-tRNA synthetase beta subunit
VTWSFLPRRKAERFGGGGEDLRLLNSIDATLDTMRPSILPNLIDAAARNEARGLGDPALFEVGPIYRDATPAGQRPVAAGLRHNMAVPRNWAGPPARSMRSTPRPMRWRCWPRSARRTISAPRRGRPTGITPAAPA